MSDNIEYKRIDAASRRAIVASKAYIAQVAKLTLDGVGLQEMASILKQETGLAFTHRICKSIQSSSECQQLIMEWSDELYAEAKAKLRRQIAALVP